MFQTHVKGVSSKSDCKWWEYDRWAQILKLHYLYMSVLCSKRHRFCKFITISAGSNIIYGKPQLKCLLYFTYQAKGVISLKQVRVMKGKLPIKGALWKSALITISCHYYYDYLFVSFRLTLIIVTRNPAILFLLIRGCLCMGIKLQGILMLD